MELFKCEDCGSEDIAVFLMASNLIVIKCRCCSHKHFLFDWMGAA